MRVVLDANVLISGVISPSGSCAVLMNAWRAGYFENVACPALILEVAEKLRAPRIQKRYHVSDADVDDVLTAMGPASSLFVPATAAVTPQPPDPDDAMLFSAAIETDADYIITGDGALLKFSWPGRTEIITPGQFWKQIQRLPTFTLNYPVYAFEDLPGNQFQYVEVEGKSAVAIFTTWTDADLYRRNHTMAPRLVTLRTPKELAYFLQRALRSGTKLVAFNPVGRHSLTQPIRQTISELEAS